MDEWQSGADSRRLIESTAELICSSGVWVCVNEGRDYKDWIEKLKWFSCVYVFWHEWMDELDCSIVLLHKISIKMPIL